MIHRPVRERDFDAQFVEAVPDAAEQFAFDGAVLVRAGLDAELDDDGRVAERVDAGGGGVFGRR